jgi:hypothetical protein
MLHSDEKDRLSGKVEALPASNVAAGHHIVDANHIRARFGKGLAVMIVGSVRNLRFLGTDHPANRERAFLAAMGAGQRNLLGLFFFVVKALFIHGGLAFSFEQFVETQQFISSLIPTWKPVFKGRYGLASIPFQ